MADSGVERDPLGRKAADPAAILATLTRHEVDFLVVGGIAARAHGNPRTTLDVDVLPNPSADNMRRLAAALEELEAVATDDRRSRMPLDLSHPESLAVGNYFLDTRFGGLDLVNGPRPDLIRYRKFAERALDVRLRELPIRIIGLDDLIRMKREGGREKDLRDIAALTEVERHQKGGTDAG
jgi:hypothetical protein